MFADYSPKSNLVLSPTGRKSHGPSPPPPMETQGLDLSSYSPMVLNLSTTNRLLNKSETVDPLVDTSYSSPGSLSTQSAEVNRKSRTNLTLETKLKIIQFARDNPHLRQSAIATHFSIDRTTVSKVLKKKESLLAFQDQGTTMERLIENAKPVENSNRPATKSRPPPKPTASTVDSQKVKIEPEYSDEKPLGLNNNELHMDNSIHINNVGLAKGCIQEWIKQNFDTNDPNKLALLGTQGSHLKQMYVTKELSSLQHTLALFNKENLSEDLLCWVIDTAWTSVFTDMLGPYLHNGNSHALHPLDSAGDNPRGSRKRKRVPVRVVLSDDGAVDVTMTRGEGTADLPQSSSSPRHVLPPKKMTDESEVSASTYAASSSHTRLQAIASGVSSLPSAFRAVAPTSPGDENLQQLLASVHAPAPKKISRKDPDGVKVSYMFQPVKPSSRQAQTKETPHRCNSELPSQERHDGTAIPSEEQLYAEIVHQLERLSAWCEADKLAPQSQGNCGCKELRTELQGFMDMINARLQLQEERMLEHINAKLNEHESKVMEQLAGYGQMIKEIYDKQMAEVETKKEKEDSGAGDFLKTVRHP